jgi:hypothetical protein
MEMGYLVLPVEFPQSVLSKATEFEIMTTAPFPAVAVAALVVLSGCAGLAGTGDDGPSPDEFPEASAIDQSVFDNHAALLSNTSFTVTFETTEKRPDIRNSSNFIYWNSSRRVLVEPGASQYLSQPNGTSDFLGSSNLQSFYSEGDGVVYELNREDNESTVGTSTYRIFNESSEWYLWQGWEELNMGSLYFFVSENVTYERQSIETYDGVDVMRYEATGVDAMPDWIREGSSNISYTDFSMSLLVDTDGVIRYYRGELDQVIDGETRNQTLVHTVSDVGSTDVDKPDGVANATAGS